MKIHWRVHRSQEVTAYLFRLRDAGRGIRQAINFLAEHGVPSTATPDNDESPTTYSWEAAGHIITCVIAEEERAIYVLDVEPLEEFNADEDDG